MGEVALILIGTVFVNNFVLAKFLGLTLHGRLKATGCRLRHGTGNRLRTDSVGRTVVDAANLGVAAARCWITFALWASSY